MKAVLIKAPIENVFRNVSNPENLAHGMTGNSQINIISVERITKNPIGKGSTWHFRANVAESLFEGNAQVTTMNPPSYLAVEQIGAGAFFKTMKIEQRLRKNKSGTQLEILVRYELKDANKKQDREIRRMLQAYLAILMERTKQLTEAEKVTKQNGASPPNLPVRV